MGKEIGEELSNKLQDASMDLWQLQNTISLHLGKDGRFADEEKLKLAKEQEQQERQAAERKQRIAERVAERKEAKRQESGQISVFDLGA